MYPISQEEFDRCLKNHLEKRLAEPGAASWLLSFTSISEELTEEFNNAILDEWAEAQPWSVEFGEDDNRMGTLTWRQDDYELILTRIRKMEGGKHYVHYVLFDKEWYGENDDYSPIFEGDDIGIPPQHDALSLATISSVLTFLSLIERDTDVDYFKNYSERQLKWRDERAEELQVIACDFKETLDKAR